VLFRSKVTGFVLSKTEPRDVEIVLAEGVVVRVRVTAADGTPLAGASATLTAKGGSAGGDVADWGRTFQNMFEGKGVTDTNGELELGRFAPGTYVLDVRRAFSRESQDVQLAAGSDVVLRATLR
jgi:hypothetical protein